MALTLYRIGVGWSRLVEVESWSKLNPVLVVLEFCTPIRLYVCVNVLYSYLFVCLFESCCVVLRIALCFANFYGIRI